jgi:hypothetical protein
MDQKVANSTVRDSINTMPWIIVTMALLNITVSLNYLMSSELCNKMNNK